MAFYRASIGGGGSASWTEVEAVSQVASGSATFTIGQSLTVGNLYHIFTTNGGNTIANTSTAAEITVSSGASNLTKIEEISGYFNSASYYSVIEHYTFVATSATVVFNKVATAKRLGYILYDTQGSGGGGQTATGTFVTNTSASSGYKVTTNFRPKLVYVVRSTSSNVSAAIYAYDIDANKYLKALPSSSAWRNFESANYMSFVSIDNDGFTFWTNDTYKTYTWNYFAMG